MTIEEVLITIAIGVIATLIASGVIWVFRKPIRQALAALDMSTGAVLAWLLVFIMLGVVIVFSLIGTEIPTLFYVMLPTVVIYVMMETVNRRR